MGTIRFVSPEIDGGKYPVKHVVNRAFTVDVGVDKNKYSGKDIKVWFKYRKIGADRWERVLMVLKEEVPPVAIYSCKVIFKKIGLYNYTVEVAIDSAREKYEKILELWVEPEIACFSSWYELFPRSQGKIPNKSGTFKDVEERIPDIKKMGFNVIYFPPIHPIGKTNRKGPNNTLWAGPGDPGCPWSVGDETGGHKSIHPELGTLDDFKHLLKVCNNNGIKIALDLTLTCSYDHPYIKEHPNWFFYNSDGTIRYAENPPKKYEDTVPLNFYPEDKEAMWNEMKSIVEYWIEQGVEIFRVDNPHTKPVEFWSWLIREIKTKYPQVIFLSEAFTYYEKLELLAKVGFSQSYTYFTWRNKKNELIEYLIKLTGSYLRFFLRPNFFTNTPDILPTILQVGGRPAFKMRLLLAATLSPTYGIYSSFELCENNAIPGTESYKDSEKYQYKVWDWDRPGNIKDYISKINKIRNENSALQYLDNLKFINSVDDNVLCYSKISPDNKNKLVIVVNLDPFNVQTTRVTVPVEELHLSSDEEYCAHELITDRRYIWRGRENYVRLDPQVEPGYVFRIEDLGRKKVSYQKSTLAETHAKYFFELHERIVKNLDLEARRQLATFWHQEVAPRVYTGHLYDEDYSYTMNEIAKAHGYDSIIDAFMSTPGH
jgi:starch synthase (maltosyl-transferring)